MLESLVSTLQSRSVEIYRSAVKKQVWEVLDRAGLITLLGPNRFFSTDREAVNGLCKGNGETIAA
jgi:SulP family sulfate permease